MSDDLEMQSLDELCGVKDAKSESDDDADDDEFENEEKLRIHHYGRSHYLSYLFHVCVSFCLYWFVLVVG